MRRWCFFIALVISLPLYGADYGIEKIDTTPPEAVSEAIRNTLGGGGIRVTSGDQAIAEFWFREAVPTQDSSSAGLGVSFTSLEQGVFVGVVHLAQEWRDYKNLKIAPGVYTLRYGIEPQDGNHMGVSIYRDFLLLIPVKQDTEVEVAWTADELYLQSYGATGQPHPGVMALFPIYDEISEPSIVMNDMDQPTLAVELGSLKMGLVLEGHGEI